MMAPVGLASELMHAWALFLAAAFVVLMLAGRARPVTAGLTASVFALGAITAWSWLIGTRWRDLELAVARAGWEACRQLLAQANLPVDRLAGFKTYVDLIGEGIPVVAGLLPGLLVLSALPGLCLAWAWYRRLASEPAVPPAGRFADFTFSDLLVWLVVLSVGGTKRIRSIYLPSPTVRPPRAFHHNPARKAWPPSPLSMARSRPGVAPLQRRAPCLSSLRRGGAAPTAVLLTERRVRREGRP